MIKAIRSLALALGLLGSAALTGMGPLGAHAAASHSIRPFLGPSLSVAAANCGGVINGSNFTPGGVVDLYVSSTDGIHSTYKETAVWLPIFGAKPGTFTQLISDGNNATFIQAVAYDETSGQYSNWSSATEYCLQ